MRCSISTCILWGLFISGDVASKHPFQHLVGMTVRQPAIIDATLGDVVILSVLVVVVVLT